MKTYVVTESHEAGIEILAGEIYYEHERTEHRVEDGAVYINLLCEHGAPIWVRMDLIEVME